MYEKNDCPAKGGLGLLCAKFFLIMNGSILLILLSSLQVFALEGRSQQKIDLDLKGKTIVSVIKYIENRYQYRFFITIMKN